MKKLFLLLVLCIAFPITSFADDEAPLNLVKSTVNKIIEVVKQYPGDSQTKVRRAEIRKIIEPVFNFNEMAKRSLGDNWNKATPAQQEEYLKLFSDLLASTYLKKIDQVKEDTVSYKGHKVKGDQALVKTDVNYNGDLFPMIYKMKKDSTGWRVYDVSIENISLVVNYRNEFAGIVRKDKIEGLINQLKEKVKKEDSAK